MAAAAVMGIRARAPPLRNSGRKNNPNHADVTISITIPSSLGEGVFRFGSAKECLKP
jgi:hypothetical protein